MNAIKSHSIKNKIKTTAKKLNIKYNIAWIILRVLKDKVEQIIKNPEKIKINKFSKKNIKKLGEKRDLNPWLLESQSNVLPSELYSPL